MIKIALVVPCSNFIKNAFLTFEEHCMEDPEYLGEKYSLEEIVVTPDNVRDIKIDADVIVTRGLLAEILKSIQTDIPIIEIHVPGSDLMTALDQCKKTFGNRKVGVIGAKNMIYGTENLSRILGLPVKSYVLDKTWNGQELVCRAINDGCEVILGGLNTCQYAQTLGIDNLMVQTGRESFWQCITEAKRAAQISRREQEKAEKFKTIMDYSHEGIMSIDSAKRITTINRAAESILKISLIPV